MANTIHDIKNKLSATGPVPNHPVGDSNPPPQQQQTEGEQTFNILPHPAKSNDPADLQKPAEGTGGLRSGQGPFGAFSNNPGPVVPDQSMLKNMPPAKPRDELRTEAAELNNQGSQN